MACSTIRKIRYDLCASNMGGIQSIALANAGDVSGITIGTATTISTDGKVQCITDIKMKNTGVTFYNCTVRKNSTSFNSTLNVNDNGTSYVSTVLSYAMPHMNADKRASMNALMLASDGVIAIVKDSNGHYWMIGDKDNPCFNTAGTGETGVAKGDTNQYTFELTAEQSYWPYEIVASAATAVFDSVSKGYDDDDNQQQGE